MKGLKSYLIGGTLMLVLYLLAQYFKPKPTDWTPTYLKEDKIPFGLYILHHELAGLFPGTTVQNSRLPIYNTLKDKNFSNTNYLLTATKIEVDTVDYRELVKFMQQGNHVFIAAFDLGKLLNDTLKIESQSTLTYNKRKNTGINFINPVLKTKNGYSFERGIGDEYFSKIDTLRATVLGTTRDGKANFIKYNFGKGALYILPDPQLFSNYILINPKTAEYASKALSFLPVSRTLIWDEHYTRGSEEDKAILRVIFKYDQLRWAYSLSLISLLVFVLFEIKRRQRIIPVLVPLTNSSVEFAALVGKVYYEKRDNLDLAQKIINYFLEQIRTTYRLKTVHADEEMITTLIVKSGAEEVTTRQLFKTIHAIGKMNTVSDEQLILLNKLTEEFYKQAQ